jgi:hypothetical protein
MQKPIRQGLISKNTRGCSPAAISFNIVASRSLANTSRAIRTGLLRCR